MDIEIPSIWTILETPESGIQISLLWSKFFQNRKCEINYLTAFKDLMDKAGIIAVQIITTTNKQNPIYKKKEVYTPSSNHVYQNKRSFSGCGHCYYYFIDCIPTSVFILLLKGTTEGNYRCYELFLKICFENHITSKIWKQNKSLIFRVLCTSEQVVKDSYCR